MRGGAAVLRASGASLVAGGPTRGLTEQGPARVGASRLVLWGEPRRHPSRPIDAERSLSYSSSWTPAAGALGCRAADAGFRVVSASHTTSRRKFRSHRSDLRAPPRLIERPPSGVSRMVFGI